eukprot:EG_transcript_1735
MTDPLATARGYARAAVAEDARGNSATALAYYEEACGVFLAAVRAGEVADQRGVRAAVAAYLDRIEQLKGLGVAVDAEDEDGPDGPAEDEDGPDPAEAAAAAVADAARSPAARSVAVRSRLLDAAMLHAAAAQQLEGNRRYLAARGRYLRAAEQLEKFLGLETDPRAAEVAAEKRRQWHARALRIDAALRGAGEADPAASPAGQPPSSVPRPPTLVKRPPTSQRWAQAAVLQHNPLLLEERTLLHSSRIQGQAYPLWDDPTEGYSAAEMGRQCPALPPLKLSKKQLAKGAKYQRPAEYLPRYAPTSTPKVVAAVSQYTIAQSLVGDCSFVCSLTVCAAYEQRFATRLISCALFPQDERGRPVYNPQGRYALKMLLNGAVRKVPVDDALPVVASDRGLSLCCAHSTNVAELWVSLYEQAYLRVHGGTYEFPGSNSGADLYALCGWIPDVVSLHDKEAKAEWSRLYPAYRDGKCLMTIATAEEKDMERSWIEKLGLVPAHAYAVLDLQEVLGKRLCLVKNPWTQQRWLGRYSHQDKVNWTPELAHALQWDVMGDYQTDTGIFWIDWNDVCAFFSRCYTSWNPYRFSHRLARHGSWAKTVKEGNSYTRNPQYHLCFQCDQPTPVWVLLARHVNVVGPEGDLFITLFIVDNAKTWPGAPPTPCPAAGPCAARRLYVHTPATHVHAGVYRNTAQYLARLDCAPGRHDYTVIVSSMEPKPFDFSLTVYTTVPTTCLWAIPKTLYPERCAFLGRPEPPPAAAPHPALYDDVLTLLDCPQYRLEVTQPTPVLIRAETGEPPPVLELYLFRWPSPTPAQHPRWRGRIDHATNGTRVGHAVGKGFACLEAHLDAGGHTLAVRCPAPFAVRVEAAGAAAADWAALPRGRVPREGEGARVTTVVGRWAPSTGTRPRFKLVPATTSTATLRARHVAGPSDAFPPGIALHLFSDSQFSQPLPGPRPFTSHAAGAALHEVPGEAGRPLYAAVVAAAESHEGQCCLRVVSDSHWVQAPQG